MNRSSPTENAPPRACRMGNVGPMLMTQGAGRTRFIVAVFDSGEDLIRAVSELLRRGFAREQMGIIALLSALSKLRQPATPIEVTRAEAEAIAAIILDDVEAAPGLRDGQVVVTRNSLWQCLGSFATAAGTDLITAQWMTPKLREDLTTFIRSGAVVLGVSANTIDQQRESTRVLLQHSSYRVQTHEFTL